MAMATGFHTISDSKFSSVLSDESMEEIYKKVGYNLTYRFFPHFHPYVPDLLDRLIDDGISGLQSADTEYVVKANGDFERLADGRYKPKGFYDGTFFQNYNAHGVLVPATGENNEILHPVKELDFTTSAAYGVYNWELFFHIPITVAIHLSKNQRFREAQRWFHYVFDPTDHSGGPTPGRFWKVRPFHYLQVRSLEDILLNLATEEDKALKQETEDAIKKLADNPFRPFIVARFRQQAYMYKTVMAYLDNLIAWGDSLFRQDTRETINEATQLYVLAALILGPRPQVVPTKGSIQVQTYAAIRGHLAELGTVIEDMEVDIPFDYVEAPLEIADDGQQNVAQGGVPALYFCIPPNEKLLGYWDTVSDRLFKIRNSLNIQGIFRQLPLFEPPIDPGLLAKAVAAGLDISAIVSGLNQPLPLIRFQFLIQKCFEICQEVKSLGSALLSALEKEDNEALTLLRQRHEKVMLNMAETVKHAQLLEARKAREGLERSIANLEYNYQYYSKLIGEDDNAIQAALTALKMEPATVAVLPDKGELDEEVMSIAEPVPDLEPIAVDIASNFNVEGAADVTGELAGLVASSREVQELAYIKSANESTGTASTMSEIGSGFAMLPNIGGKAQPFGGGVDMTFGSSQVTAQYQLLADFWRDDATDSSFKATAAAKAGVYADRERDNRFKRNQIRGEIAQTQKQLRAAQIREAIAEKEWKNHKRQMKHAEEIDHFLSGEKTLVGDKTQHKRFATLDFMSWHKGAVKELYGNYYKFLFDTAKKTEVALQHELGDRNLSFLQFGYFEGKEGLLAGEKLYLDLKRMELAYHELNQREYELTKHVSLLQVNPLALVELRANGTCTFQLPETLFDIDGPGHFFRRIKTIAVSVPCVAGPYASVNCTLSLLKSSIRTSAQLKDNKYKRNESGEDDRFDDYHGNIQSMVTSAAQNDSGLFEANLHDERRLPFEGAGVISEWQLKLPATVRQFDYDTIADVILHIRYTAREGGELLGKNAVVFLEDCIAAATAAGSVRLISVRQEFPSEWASFKATQPETAASFGELVLNIRAQHFPFWSVGRLEKIWITDVFVKLTQTSDQVNTQISDPVKMKYGNPESGDISLNDETYTGLVHRQVSPKQEDLGPLKLLFNNLTTIKDLWIAIAWGG